MVGSKLTAWSNWRALALLAMAAACSNAGPGATADGRTGSVAQGLEVWSPQGDPLVASDGAKDNGFGEAVAVSGDTAIIGAYGARVRIGGAYAMVRTGSTWAQQGPPLSASDAGYPFEFGDAVALSGNTAIIGAPNQKVGANTVQGAAYAFVRSGTTWTEQAKFLAADGAATDNFSWAVAIEGDTAAIGAPGSDPYGSVYVFVRTGSTWTQQGPRLVPSDGLTAGDFGKAVALSGDTLVVGAPGTSIGTRGAAGSVYVFVRSGTTWTQQGERLVGADIASGGEYFGWAVAASGNTLLVGSQGARSPNVRQGAAYVFTRSGTTWTQQGARLVANDGATEDRFGWSVALAGDTAAVGAPQAGEGSAYVFTRSGTAWTQTEPKLTTSLTGAFFGGSVSLSSNTLLVGAPYANVGQTEAQGTAFAFYRAGAAGDPCTSSSDCANGLCSDNVCCDSACDGECDACSVAAGAAKDGTCKVLAAGNPGLPACDAKACNGVSATCVACAKDADCTNGHYCAANGSCKAQVDQGKSCDTAAGKDCKVAGCDVCASGNCVDGVCCDVACGDACQACISAFTGVPDGTCAPVPADQDPRNRCDEGPGYPKSCLSDGLCDGAGKCRDFAKNTTGCGDTATTCSKGSVSGKLCDGQGTCSTDTVSCAPYVCGGDACATSCETDDDCASSGYCLNETCQSKKDDGEPCANAVQCASNFCTDGVCCEAACDGQCELCNSKGACEPVKGEPQGGRDACNGDPNVCGGTCDGQTRDACTYPSSAQSCGSSCTDGQQLPSVCNSNGACVDSTPIPCGNYACGELECLTTCKSGSDCAAGFSCDGESCKPTGSKCSDDLSSSITEDDASTLCVPYVCDASSGSCKSECTSIDDCAPGNVCDASKSCVPASSSKSSDDGGCGCRVAGQTNERGVWLLLVGVGLGLRRRSQRASARSATLRKRASGSSAPSLL